jgi:hypothetical protein
MIIFTPTRANNKSNPYLFYVISEIGKLHGLTFLPTVTHPNQAWTQKLADRALSDPNSIIEFKDWAHIDFFKHSTRKKIILLDQFFIHDYYKRDQAGVHALDPDQYFPRPRDHAPNPAIDRYPDRIDYSWADLIICVQEENLSGPEWLEFFNNPGAYFLTDSDRVITIVSGLNSDLSYQNVFPPNVLHVPLNFWCAWTTVCNDPVEYNADYDRPYKFEALLGGSKENRQFVFRKLKKHNLLEQGLVSISAQTFRAPTDRCYHDDFYRSPDLDVYDNKEMLDMRRDSRKGNWIAHTTGGAKISRFPLGNGRFTTHIGPYGSFFIPHRVYQESWFSIVAESIVRNSDFYTEKTAKALLGRRVFITFGPQYSLKVLRDNGFKTFGAWIDESYDDEPDDEIRWSLAFEQVVRLINHPNLKSLHVQAQAVLEHNYQLVSDQRSMLKPIDDFIQSFLTGTAPSCVGSVPMTQHWTPAQQLAATKKHHPVQFEQDSPGAAFAPYSPEILQGTTVRSKNTTVSQPIVSSPEILQGTTVRSKNTTVSQPIVIQPNRRFNDHAILQALEQARAETAKKQQGLGR